MHELIIVAGGAGKSVPKIPYYIFSQALQGFSLSYYVADFTLPKKEQKSSCAVTASCSLHQ